MPRFFNRIRKQLAKDKKFFQYSRYAVGEILLVVIGIVIALQVDNWNEVRKDRIAEIEYLKKLLKDLRYDINQFSYLDSIYIDWSRQIEWVTENTLSGELESLTSPEQYGIGRGSFFYLTIKQTTYDEMKSTGSLYKMESANLSEEISNYYVLASFETTKLNKDNQNFADYVLNPALKEQKNITFRLHEQRNLEHIDWGWLKDPSSDLYKELENRIIWFKYAIEANRRVLDTLTVKSQILIDRINPLIQ